MKSKQQLLFFALFLVGMLLPIFRLSGQTYDELNTRVKQLEADKRALEAKVKKLQQGKSKSAAEAEETIQQLLAENDSLWSEIENIRGIEKTLAKAEADAKSVKLNIKDPVFFEYLLRFCDMDDDGNLTQWDAEHTYVIDIAKDRTIFGNSNRITSIEGIEYFVNLKRLVCSGNSIPQIDLSKNVLLETFIANGCDLKILDVSKNERLTHLECNNNLLYTVDLKGNLNLLTLDVSKNKIAFIDISKCVKLKALNCSGNTLTDLDVSQNVELQTLNCSNNKIGILSFAKNAMLDNINCSSNKLTEVDIRNGIDIKFIDCSKNKDLDFVYVSKGCRVLSDKREAKTYIK